jgi:hypothetical protein
MVLLKRICIRVEQDAIVTTLVANTVIGISSHGHLVGRSNKARRSVKERKCCGLKDQNIIESMPQCTCFMSPYESHDKYIVAASTRIRTIDVRLG